MKQKLAIVCSIVLAMNAWAGKEETAKPQTTCPVMGGKVNKALYADVEGKRVYVCCKGCIGAIEKDPAKYLKKIADKGETVATLQTKCPVMGGKIDKKLYVDVKGKRVYVCCAGCIAPIKKDPDKYFAKLEKAGEVPYDAPKK